VRALIILIGILLFTACKKDVGKVSFGDYPYEIGTIIKTNCATSGCHNSNSYLAAGGLNLETWSSMFQGSNSGLPVIPYSSEFSVLTHYINTYPELGPMHEPVMPLNKEPLSYDQVQKIQSWINEGAPDINGKVRWAGNAGLKKLYAVNQGCDVVTIFDSETRVPIRYISVGNKSGNDTPHHLRVSPDGKFWYVIFINNNIMQKYSCEDDSFVGNIPLTPMAAGSSSDPNDDALDWNTFVISSDGTTAWCVSWQQSGKIAKVDLVNRKLIRFIGGQHWPHGITVDQQDQYIYVGSQTGNFVTRFNADLTGALEIPLESEVKYHSSLDPHDLMFSPDGSSLYITCQGTDEVRVLNLNTNAVSAVIPTGDYPQEIIYSARTNQYFVSCPGFAPAAGSTGIITSIDGGTNVASNILCGFQPHGIAADENTNLLYVLSRNIAAGGPIPHHTSLCDGRNGFVNFIDMRTLKVRSEKFELSVDPYFIYARP
jgi:YVTN family beta-propeller protein